MGQHALGPYVVGMDDEYERCPFIPIFAADGGVVAEVPADYSGKKPKLTKAVRATADLLAASFDMLEALEAQEAAEQALIDGPDSQGYEHWQELEDRATELRRAAIAKATGGGQ
jgi:hypothetical protein